MRNLPSALSTFQYYHVLIRRKKRNPNQTNHPKPHVFLMQIILWLEKWCKLSYFVNIRKMEGTPKLLNSQKLNISFDFFFQLGKYFLIQLIQAAALQISKTCKTSLLTPEEAARMPTCHSAHAPPIHLSPMGKASGEPRGHWSVAHNSQVLNSFERGAQHMPGVEHDMH